MFLSDEEKEMLDGNRGPGVQRAMDLLVKFGDAFNAERMVKLSSVHELGAAPLDWLYEVKEGGTKVRTFTSMHALYLDPKYWREMGVPERYGERQQRLISNVIKEHKEMGIVTTCTCAPYLVGNVPRIGSFISWGGSSGQVFANSLLGARCDRFGGPAVLAGAITGRAPYMGLLKSENRYGEFLIKLEGDLDLSNFSYADWGAFSYYVGEKAGKKNVVIEGIHDSVSNEELKYLFSPLPVSGAVGLCHVVGITPEARTLEVAFGGKKVTEGIGFGKRELKEGWSKLQSAAGKNVDMVIFGCPHCSIAEIKDIAWRLEGKKISGNIKLWIATADQTRRLAERSGFSQVIEKAGGLLIDCCIGANTPFMYSGVIPKVVATDSARAAHYLPRTTGGRTNVIFASRDDCIEVALTGKWRG
jgi:predicted aconitase